MSGKEDTAAMPTHVFFTITPFVFSVGFFLPLVPAIKWLQQSLCFHYKKGVTRDHSFASGEGAGEEGGPEALKL